MLKLTKNCTSLCTARNTVRLTKACTAKLFLETVRGWIQTRAGNEQAGHFPQDVLYRKPQLSFDFGQKDIFHECYAHIMLRTRWILFFISPSFQKVSHPEILRYHLGWCAD